MKLIEKIKELWQKIVAWVKGASNKVDDFIIKYAPIAVSVINRLKEFNENDTVELILGMVASKYGTGYIYIVNNWLEKNLPIVVDSLNLAVEVAEEATLAEKIKAAQEGINKLPIEIKATIWTGVASMLANAIADDNKLSVSEAIAIVAYVYENNLNK